jgi:hypothetical protein
MSDRPLITWIVTAFRNLGGRAHLRDVYKEVRRLGYDRGGEDLDKIIRSEITKHCRQSPRFSGNPKHDLFSRVGEERSGIWELQEDRTVESKASSHLTISTPSPAKPEWLPDEEADRDAPSDGANYVPQAGDRRKVVERQIRERRGQQQFRNALRKRYGDRCLVSGCEVLAVLEAAHISPYRGEDDNDPSNGLLLRSDVHTLFDLDLLGIEPEGLRVELHPDMIKEYGCFACVTLRCARGQRPAREALRLRYEQFRRRLLRRA